MAIRPDEVASDAVFTQRPPTPATPVGVRSVVTFPRDDQTTLQRGTHVMRGRAWSGAGAIAQVEVSVDGGQTWHAAHLEHRRASAGCGGSGRMSGRRNQGSTVSCRGPRTRWAVSNPRSRDTTTCARILAPLWPLT